MAYNVVYKKSVYRDLKKLSRPNAKRILDLIETELIKKPESNPILKSQFAGLSKYRIGDYRVVYSVNDSRRIVDVTAVRHRSEAYRD